jgi:hypothetical protein
LLTALATIAIAWFTYTLKQSTDRLWRLGREEFLATHRPEIIIHSIEVATDASSDPANIGAEITSRSPSRAARG